MTVETRVLPERKLGWAIFGVVVQVAFAATVPLLWWFLLVGASARAAPEATPLLPALGWTSDAVTDVLLILQFAVPHSILLHPSVRRRLQEHIPAPLYGSFFCAASIVTLVTLIGLWRPLPWVVYELDLPVSRAGMIAANALAWGALIYSMWLGGLGYQTGLTSLVHYLKREVEPRRTFTPRGAYCVFRHPIYLSFLLIAWTTPVMSAAHLILSLGFLAYSLVGSVLKDRRLAQLIGEPYRRYMAEVPGYPLWPAGPLAKVRS